VTPIEIFALFVWPAGLLGFGWWLHRASLETQRTQRQKQDEMNRRLERVWDDFRRQQYEVARKNATRYQRTQLKDYRR
jgi:hypothetical protein